MYDLFGGGGGVRVEMVTTRLLLLPLAPVILNSTRRRRRKRVLFPGGGVTQQPSTLPPFLKYNNLSAAVAAQKEGEEDGVAVNDDTVEEEDTRVLSAIKTRYNDIIILDTPQSRILLLDSTHNIHSIFIKQQHPPWTCSYWDEFASLPPIIPNGPIAIFGLGGGTAAHLMLTLWPSLHLHGWEIDQILIDKARQHLDLSLLENPTQAGGLLHVHIGDALSDSTTISGGYAGIVVDLFSKGEVLPQLQQVQTWLEMKDKLMPNGRIMVNCGATTNVNVREYNSTLDILCKAFPGQVNWKKTQGDNHLALTGPLPDLTTWSAALPHPLSSSVMQWTCCFPS